MSHGIKEYDTVISYRDAGWHGLAKVFEEYLTPQQAYDRAFGWEPVEETLYREVPYIDEVTGLPASKMEPIDEKGLVRSDSAHWLGCVSKTFNPGQKPNWEMFEIAEALEAEDRGKDSHVKIETAGSLDNGRRVWLLARLEEPLKVKNDPMGDTIPYFAIQNAHDGTGAFKGQATMTRIICANTLRMSDVETKARGTEFSFRHTAKMQDRIDQAKQALANWKVGMMHWQEMADHLSGVKVTKEQRDDFIDLFIPVPYAQVVSDRVRNNVETARGAMRELFTSPTLEYQELTAYGMVQAAIEYSQHVRRANGDESKKRETKFARAYLDDSKMTQQAFKLVKELVAV